MVCVRGGPWIYLFMFRYFSFVLYLLLLLLLFFCVILFPHNAFHVISFLLVEVAFLECPLLYLFIFLIVDCTCTVFIYLLVYFCSPWNKWHD